MKASAFRPSREMRASGRTLDESARVQTRGVYAMSEQATHETHETHRYRLDDHCAIHGTCWLCGERDDTWWIDVDYPAPDDRGEHEPLICFRCSQATPEQLRARIMDHADDLVKRAEYVRALA